MNNTENNVAAQAGDSLKGTGDQPGLYRDWPSVQDCDEPLTERDIADLQKVIAVAERGRMPDLAAKAQAMLDSGVIPAHATKKIKQAADKSVREAEAVIEVCQEWCVAMYQHAENIGAGGPGLEKALYAKAQKAKAAIRAASDAARNSGRRAG